MNNMSVDYYEDEPSVDEVRARELRDASNAELSLLALMLSDNAIYRASGVNEAWFVSSANRKILSTIKGLVDTNQAADIMTVSDVLDSQEPHINWTVHIMDIHENILARPESVDTYVKIIREAHTKRQAMMIAKRLLADNAKGQGAVDSAIRDLMSLDTEEQRYEHDMKTTVLAALTRAEEAFEQAQKGGIVGITTGLIDLDEATGGWHNTDLVVIPARPAMGKTAALLNFALSSEVPFGIISSEQSHDQMGLRMLSIKGRVSGSKIRRGKLEENDWSLINIGSQNLMKHKFWINDDATITIDGIRRQARKWFYTNNIKLLFVDYIQRIYPTDPKQPKHIQVAEVTTGLKSLAKELGIPIIALAQVNRDCEKRADRRPLMGDIADASIIEKEADLIMTLYRDEVYFEDSPDKGIAEIGICKNRHGPIGLVRTSWNGSTFRFDNLSYNREAV